MLRYVSKGCETVSRMSNCLQISLHFLLSHLKTLSVGQAEVEKARRRLNEKVNNQSNNNDRNSCLYLFCNCLIIALQEEQLKTYEANWLAKLSILSSSKLVVGSSSVRIPQFKQNVSARANLIISDART